MLAAVGLSKSDKGRGRPLSPLPLATTTATGPGSCLVKPSHRSSSLGFHKSSYYYVRYPLPFPRRIRPVDLPFLAQGADRLQPAPIALFWERFSFHVHLTRPGSFFFTLTPLTGSKTLRFAHHVTGPSLCPRESIFHGPYSDPNLRTLICFFSPEQSCES